jgi:hypothetical protein
MGVKTKNIETKMRRETLIIAGRNLKTPKNTNLSGNSSWQVNSNLIFSKQSPHQLLISPFCPVAWWPSWLEVDELPYRHKN